MVNQIYVENRWSPRVQKLALKFNRYAKKKSLNSVVEVLEQLIDMLTGLSEQDSLDAADVLTSIRYLNPSLFTDYTTKKINNKIMMRIQRRMPVQVLLTGQMEESDFYDDDYDIYEDPNKLNASYSENNDGLSFFRTDTSSSSPSSSSETGYEKYLDFNQQPGQYNQPGEYNQHGQYDQPEQYGESAQYANYQEYNPEEDNDSDEIDPMQLTIKQLGIKHVKKVQLKPEFYNRKCAMGDGEFGEDYTGEIYECDCGTLYHETCLKVQAIYVGKCQICDREFLHQ